MNAHAERTTPRDSLDALMSKVRDALLDWSRESLQADTETERARTDAIFSLAKEADDLRRRIAEVREQVPSARPIESGSGAQDPAANTALPSSAPTRRRKRDYPKYVRRGDALVKVGLSKDKRTEYKHIVPASEYKRVAELIGSVGKGKREFTAEDILKGFDGASYHSYIVLALLREKKAVALVRRGTYRLGVKLLEPAIEAIWKALPEESHE